MRCFCDRELNPKLSTSYACRLREEDPKTTHNCPARMSKAKFIADVRALMEQWHAGVGALALAYFPFSFHVPSTSTMLGTYWSPRPALVAIA